MKYLLLIIRHLFPRRIWTDVSNTKVYGDPDAHNRGEAPVSLETIQRDQFGNLRRFKH